MTEFPKAYEPQTIEQKWYPIWESLGFFQPHGSGRPYCIVIPPPNVTGSLHMGHALQHTLMDALSRWRRMQGRRVLWLPGQDHAGIATQVLVERQLKDEGGPQRVDLGREAFEQRVWKWKEESGGTILGQMRREGAELVRLIDASPVPLSTLCGWTKSNGRFRGMKLHVVYDPKQDVPRCVEAIPGARPQIVNRGKVKQPDPESRIPNPES